MIFLTAEKQAAQFYFKVQMDADPKNIREFTWGLTPPPFQPVQTETEYIAMMKREIGLLVADELKSMQPPPAPTPLVGF